MSGQYPLDHVFRTVDGHEIKNGLLVWDYDLRQGVVEIVFSEYDRKAGTWDGWFRVHPLDENGEPLPGIGSLMNAERVTVRHPTGAGTWDGSW